MKRKKVVLLVVIGSIILLILTGFSVSVLSETDVVGVGKYRFSDKEIKESLLLSVLTGKSDASIESTARHCAEIQLAKEEIKGTKYDVPDAREEEFYKQEKERYDRNTAANDALCRKYGITSKELIRCLVLSKMENQIRLQHMQKVSADLMAKNPAKQFTPEELTEEYACYLEKSLERSSYQVLDENAFEKIEKLYEALKK